MYGPLPNGPGAAASEGLEVAAKARALLLRALSKLGCC